MTKKIGHKLKLEIAILESIHIFSMKRQTNHKINITPMVQSQE